MTQVAVSPVSEKSATSRLPWQCIAAAIAIFFFPFIATPWSLTAEFSKQLFLSLAVGIAVILVLKNALKRKFIDFIPRHLFVPLGIATIVFATISAWQSGLRHQGLFGYGGTESIAVFSLLLLGLWILLTYHGGRENSKLPYLALIASGSVLSLITIISLLGLNIYRFIPSQGFNPAGTTTTATMIAAATIVLGVGRLLNASSRRAIASTLIALVPPALLIVGTGFRAPLIIVAVGLGLLALRQLKKSEKRTPPTAILLITLGTLLSIVLAVRPFLNFLKTPLEVGPSHRETWSIALQTLGAHPLLGSGPATFSADYLRFRSLPILQTPFWNISFDWGSSTGLTWLATLGFIGTGLLILTVLSVLVSYGWQKWRKESTTEETALFAAGVALFVGAWLVPMPLAAKFFFDTLLGLMLAHLNLRPLKLNLVGLARPTVGSLIILLVLGLFTLQGRRAFAEATVLKGATIGISNLSTTESYLTKATRLDPWNDSYLRLLTETRRGLLRQKLAEAPSDKETQTALQELRDITDKILASARRATELAPQNSTNWIMLGSVYLDISPITGGAALAAVDAFSRALELSPSDPSLLVNLGVAKALATSGAKEEETKLLTQSAEELLRKAANIRPNYVFAHLELARLLAQKQDVEGAIQAYRRAQAVAQNDSALRYEIGLYLLQNQRKDAAQVELEEAVRLAENFSNARWFLAQIYEEQGDIEKAIEQIQKVVELNPDNQQAKDRLEELKKKLEEKK
ncbi:hypothetical protein A3J03_00315 [Candidatus Uhrbacteria bacterium RIFCSPLOWO2_02_FULL_46_25]|nr:MAG: hypothetical protein A3J03_00315 [Candidatus Uhrbacteria bacterium RIFCSPLOWO2_02_FULL_46_25]